MAPDNSYRQSSNCFSLNTNKGFNAQVRYIDLKYSVMEVKLEYYIGLKAFTLENSCQCQKDNRTASTDTVVTSVKSDKDKKSTCPTCVGTI